MRKAKRRPKAAHAVDTPTIAAQHCRECSKLLTSPRCINRRLCRSCWRVVKAVAS